MTGLLQSAAQALRLNVITVAWLAGACLAPGCMVGPNYAPSQPAVPAGWVGPTGQMTAASEKQAALARWWTTFQDPTLTSLVERAVESNLDLQQAAARLRQARALRGEAAAALWPQVTAGGGFSRGRASAMNGPGPLPAHSLFQVGLDASWEIDIFGGLRRNIEAADAGVDVAVENMRGVLVTVAAEVALDYMDLRGLQQRLVIAKRNLDAQKHTADLTRQRLKGGLVSGLDVANAEAAVASTASTIPLLESQAQQTAYALAVLLGQPPASLVKELGATAEIPPVPPEVPIALPAELLRRRPDIRQAEAQIHADTALLGVAVSALYPTFSLTGNVGFQSNTLESLMSGRNGLFSFGPSFSWTLFDGGRIESNIAAQRTVQEQSVIAYQQAVLAALEDVENALIAYAKQQENRKALIDAVASNRKALDLSTQLYTQGLADFLNVLVAQKNLFDSEDALVQSTQAVSTNLVALYKALGGGWNVPEAAPAPPAAGPRSF